MSKKIVILVLCGLPGAGKTTFAHNIQRYVTNASLPVNSVCKQTTVKYTWVGRGEPTDHQRKISLAKITCYHVSYDDLMPTNLDFQDGNGEEGAWKRIRNEIKSCVENDMRNSSAVCDSPSDIVMKYESIKSMSREIDTEDGDHLHLYIVDDNMFFSSMRYEYFQLSRKYNTGYAQIYLQCSTEEAQLRNELRPSPILASTIVTMATKFEPPDPGNHWEQMSLTIESDECCQDDNLQRSWELILHALDHPVQSVEVDEVKRSTDRVVCSQSIIHQTDLVIRKLIGQKMAELNEPVIMDKDAIKLKAAELSQRKLHVLREMRSGQILVARDLEHFVMDASKDSNNPLYQFIKNLFES